MEGMTGTKTRHFYNNLLDISGACYLEIGSWKGSSACSAMFENTAEVFCIDNWSEFQLPCHEFFSNLNKYKGNNNCRFLCEDSFEVDIKELPKFNIYLYDGNHSQESHKKALTHYIDTMDDTFIFIVDDWNWQQVKDGTQEGIQELGLKVLWEKTIECEYGDEKQEFTKTWWNGMWAAVLQKP